VCGIPAALNARIPARRTPLARPVQCSARVTRSSRGCRFPRSTKNLSRSNGGNDLASRHADHTQAQDLSARQASTCLVVGILELDKRAQSGARKVDRQSLACDPYPNFLVGEPGARNRWTTIRSSYPLRMRSASRQTRPRPIKSSTHIVPRSVPSPRDL